MSQNQHDIARDGANTPTPENAHGVAAQQQGEHRETKSPSSEGHHGGNHGNDANDAGTARRDTAQGSSHRGDMPNAESENTGGGSDKEHKNQTKNTTDSKTDYKDGNAAPSSANDGGKIGDADNPV